MKLRPAFPTSEHERAAAAITAFFSDSPEVEAVILMGSCARGKATRDSCLDILVLVPPSVLATDEDTLTKRWNEFYGNDGVFRALGQVGRYSHIDLVFTDGQFAPKPRDWTSGPDEFELEIGNTLVYSVPLWQRGGCLAHLKARWLPYYDEALRQERLAMVRRYCLNNLDHVPLMLHRGLCFQAFNRLYDGFREFLQALFISRRTYPIAYDKWIREQVEDILGLPELYRRLPRLFEISNFESQEIAQKGEDLRDLFGTYVPA